MGQSVYAVATMDTKGHELAYVAERLRAAGVAVVTVDVGTLEPPVITPDVDRAAVAVCHPTTDGRVYLGSRVTVSPNGSRHYEYAIENYDMDRAIGSFILSRGDGPEDKAEFFNCDRGRTP